MDDERTEPNESDASAAEDSSGEDSGIVRAVLTGGGGGGDDGPPPMDGPLDALVRGTTVGNYVILSPLSGGQDNNVYAAFDARLDRKVALKLVDVPEDDEADTEQLRDTMITAAMRSGGLDHPGIVQVLDAGTVGDAVFVAMEFIDGIDLRQWMEARDDPFPWPEVLRVFREAGTAVAAAHAAGVVHGDFTPSRVFLEKSGRICVFDFGLATRVAEVSTPGLSVDSLREGLGVERSRDEDSLVQQPTRAELYGTPRYLAPELHAGMEPDAKADQFAFCAAMYEALYGEVPFKGDTPGKIAGEALSHAVRPAPEGSDVPQWLREVLLKGMSPRRRDRYSSMEVLLRHLEHDPKGRRRRWVAGVAVIGTVAAASGGVALLLQHEASRCEADAQLLAGAWDTDTRAALEDAFVSSGRSVASESWDQVQAGMDEWSGQWLEYHSLACRVRQADDDDALLARRNACLDGVLRPFAAFTKTLTDGDPSPQAFDSALRVVTGLWRPADCRSPDMLDYAAPTAAGTGDGAAVDQAWLQLLAGRHTEARAQALDAATQLSRSENHGLLVRAKLTAGLAAARAGTSDATALLHDAAAEASAASLRIPQAEAWIALARIEGASALEHARTLVDALKVDRLRAQLLVATGGHHHDVGRDRDALAAYHEALALLQSSDTRSTILRGDILLELSELALSRNEWTTATQYLQEVLSLREATFGALHTELVAPLRGLGRAQAGAGDTDAAVRSLERGLTIAKQNRLPPATLAALLLALGDIESDRDDATQSATHYQQAIEALDGTKNDDQLADALFGLGLARLDAGTPSRATAPLERASVLASRVGWNADRRVALLEALALSLAEADPVAAADTYREALELASPDQAVRIEASLASLAIDEDSP